MPKKIIIKIVLVVFIFKKYKKIKEKKEAIVPGANLLFPK